MLSVMQGRVVLVAIVLCSVAAAVGRVTVGFVNARDSPVNVYWVGHDDQLGLNAEHLQPGQTAWITSFPGHRFVAEDIQLEQIVETINEETSFKAAMPKKA